MPISQISINNYDFDSLMLSFYMEEQPLLDVNNIRRSSSTTLLHNEDIEHENGSSTGILVRSISSTFVGNVEDEVPCVQLEASILQSEGVTTLTPVACYTPKGSVEWIPRCPNDSKPCEGIEESGDNNSGVKKKQIASFIGSNEVVVDVLNPEKCSNKGSGSGKRKKSQKEIAVDKSKKNLRLCRACNQLAAHDSRNCPTNKPKGGEVINKTNNAEEESSDE